MSPQTETKASVGFKAGVKEYKLTYYTPEYETKDTDILLKQSPRETVRFRWRGTGLGVQEGRRMGLGSFS
jgi:hypothetical protein